MTAADAVITYVFAPKVKTEQAVMNVVTIAVAMSDAITVVITSVAATADVDSGDNGSCGGTIGLRRRQLATNGNVGNNGGYRRG